MASFLRSGWHVLIHSAGLHLYNHSSSVATECLHLSEFVIFLTYFRSMDSLSHGSPPPFKSLTVKVWKLAGAQRF